MSKIKPLLYILSSLILGCFLAMIAIGISGLTGKISMADVALVLGSKVEIDGTPSRCLRARLDKTLDLYQSGYFPAIIVSGGKGKENHNEAEVMRGYLVAHGVPSGSILVDNLGVNTFASTKGALQIMHDRKMESILVISQYFHLPRARLALKRFGIDPIYSSPATFFEGRDVYSLVREVAAYIHYSFRSYKIDQPK